MVKKIVMPPGGQTTDTSTVAKWLVKKGDKVKMGDPLLEVETDKATLTVESFASGTVLDILVKEGEEADTGEVLALIGKPGDLQPEADNKCNKDAVKEQDLSKIDAEYDITVIGGGPGGYSAAITAAKKGAKVLIIEKENLGGTCLNVGCIPTKYLLDKGALMDKINSMTDSGIFKDAGLYSFKKIQEGRLEVIKKLVGGVEYLLKANKVTLVRGAAKLNADGSVSCGDKVFKTSKVIIATGSEPIKIPIPGAEYTIDSTAMLDIQKVPSRLVVMGGGVIGMEIASAFNSFGSEVTVIEMMDKLFPAEERDAVSFMVKSLKKRGIKIITGGKILEVKKNQNDLTVIYDEAGEKSQIATDVVLMAVGRRASLQGVDAERLGIKLQRNGSIEVNEYMETTMKNVYAIGDAAGGYQLAHAAFIEGETAVENALGGNKKLSEELIPRCIYTIPSFAAVGMTVKDAEAQGRKCARGQFSYSANGMALAKGAEGVVYVTMDQDTKETLGVQIVGDDAPEMISFAETAISKKMTLEDWENLIVAHPSLSEMVKEAAMDCFNLSVHGPVRK